jgi:hypothetical protein
MRISGDDSNCAISSLAAVYRTCACCWRRRRVTCRPCRISPSRGGERVLGGLYAIIRELVDGEKTDEVLSDDAIVDILKEGGVEIARRTVAKYRGHEYTSSVQRRREKQALAAVGR